MSLAPPLARVALLATAWFLVGTGTAGAVPTWKSLCSGNGAERRCTASMRQSYLNTLGGLNQVTVSLMRENGCETLHVVFDRPVDMNRPVGLAVDGGDVAYFYSGDELAGLARALDEGTEAPAEGPPEFTAFLGEVDGAKFTDPGAEMVARFARLKEPLRLGMACAATSRLMPSLRAGRMLHLAFSARPGNRAQPYHWPRLRNRAVDIPLEGLFATLDEAASLTRATPP
ncbi:MAG TPA: hypothetical protein VEB64_06930 [Azospirillaceae bacterium]|nr:hypothetical protein [Azospirillaceae bacterium]